MPTRLRVVDQQGSDGPFDVAPGAVAVVGRTPGADICLRDLTVARRHARFFDRDGDWFVEDLGSHCGIWVNGRVGRGACPLHDGDVVRIGSRALVVELVAWRPRDAGPKSL